MDHWRQPRRLLLALVIALIVVFLVFPILVVIPMGFTSSESLSFPPRGFSTRWYERQITEPNWRRSLLNSLRVAFGTVVTSLAVGVPLALGLMRGRFPGQRLLAAFVITPLVMPTVIVAIGVFYTWSLGWAIGPIRFGSKLTGSALGLILAHTALAIPMVVVLCTASLRTVDRTFELAAAGLGANPWNTFWTITFPLMLPGIAGAAVFAFLTSWDEALVSLFLTNANFPTFPVRMFLQVREAVDPSVAAAATVFIALTTALFTFALLFRARGLAH